MTEAKIACNLPPEQLGARREALRQGLFARVREKRELDDGYAFALPNDEESWDEAQAFAAFEEGCCGFARYAVCRDPAADTIWLEIRGPEGTKDFIRRMLARDSPPATPETAGRAVRRGWLGVGTGVVALLLCDVPILLGFAGAGALGLGLEAVGAAALLFGGGALAYGLLRKRRTA